MLKGNELDKNKQKDVDLIFRKALGNSFKYKELVCRTLFLVVLRHKCVKINRYMYNDAGNKSCWS